MTRLHWERPLDTSREGVAVTVTGDEAHYLSRVLRLAPGDRVALFWGDGQDYVYRVDSLDRHGVRLVFEKAEANQADPSLVLTLVQGIPKAGKLDGIIRGVTGLGIGAVMPFHAIRSIGRAEVKKVARWEKIAAETARQCGRSTVPRIHAPAGSLRAALKELGETRGILCWEESAAPLNATLEGMREAARIAIICGPEGGLTPEEAGVAEEAGFAAVSLGPRILRSELAPLAITAVVMNRLGDLG